MRSAAVSFHDFRLNKQLWNAVGDAGFEQPTPVQEKVIPLLLAGHDVLAVAQTGTGKTAAYLLPLLMKIKYAQGDVPRALVLVPTRELAIQVRDQVQLLGKYTDLRCAALFGGTGMKGQQETLEAGADIVVATPGRFLDLYRSGHLVVKKTQVFVMDEAERLLDMGFKKQINSILEVVPKKRQNALFSATMNEHVRRVAADFLDRPVEVNITPEVRTARTVSQVQYRVPNLRMKIHLLEHLLTDPDYRRVIVFCKTKDTANNIYKYLDRKHGADFARVVHGNKDQNTRLNAIRAFRDGSVRVLVTTDVAARGIDIDEVSHVVNFDAPLVYEDYVHRIGRTGRAFRTGASLTFCSPDDEYHVRKIEKLIGNRIPVLELPAAIPTEETPPEERQRMLRAIDAQRRKEDPLYGGAFHEKKGKTRKSR